ncbi:MAG: T9SS type A sorting domain-containing protein [bacterium]
MKHLNKFSKVLFVIILTLLSTSLYSQDTKGTDFWFMFNRNDLSSPQELSIFITSDVNTSGTVDIAGIGFSTPYSVTAGTVTTVIVPNAASLHVSDVIDNIAIHLTALNEVTVYGLNRVTFTTDAFLALPTDILGTDYYYLNYKDNGNGHLMGIIATQNNTTVTITPTITIGSHPANVPFNLVMQQGESWEILQQTALSELTGTKITSDKPIGVMGVHRCVNVPQGVCCCDHIVEMLFPTNTWGKNFLTSPLATRTQPDTWRILAGTNATVVTINGLPQAAINAGQFIEVTLGSNSTINSNEPVLVAQYSNSQSVDNVVSDPFMMLVPPFEQFLAAYTISTPASGFAQNFTNVVAPNSIVGSLALDGVPIPVILFTPIGASGYSAAKVPLTAGSHNLVGSLPFGCFVYGFDSFDSYGYPGGGSLSQIAVVATLNVEPEFAINNINTQHCVTGLVLDQNGAPVQGVRVDFIRNGVNPGIGFAFTDPVGIATYCYVGTTVGRDTIIGTTGNLSDTVIKEWDDPSPVELSSFTSSVSGKNVTLNWTTSEELNNSGFDIERSVVNGEWTKLAFVQGNGTTTNNMSYTFSDKNLNSGKYNYRLKQIDFNGNFTYYDLGSEVTVAIPNKFNLSQNYPNPFNPTTKIDFELPTDGNINLYVYDNSGKLVSTLSDGFKSAGYYSIQFNAANIASGVYFYKLEFSSASLNTSKVMKMTILK